MPQSVLVVHSLKVLESQSSPCKSGYGDHFFLKEFLKENLLLWGLFKGMISALNLAAVRIDWLVIKLFSGDSTFLRIPNNETR